MNITERYHAQAAGINEVVPINGDAVYGFIAVTAGTITIARSSGTIVLNAFPVSPGVQYPLSIFLGSNGGTVTLAGGASGTILK